MDTSGHGNGGDSEPEGIFIGHRLKELAQALGMNQRQLALLLGVDPRHFNSLWLDKKRAGLPLISRVARNSGRSIAWVCGEEAARPQIGTAIASGRVMLTASTVTQGTILFVEPSIHFRAGTRLLVDPGDRFAVGQWLLVRPRAGGEAWLGGADVQGGVQYLVRADGEVSVYSPERHEIVGVIVGELTPAPEVPSALR